MNKYICPKFEVISITNLDIIATSGVCNDETPPPTPIPPCMCDGTYTNNALFY